jgi:hypothetical protein
MKLLLEIALWIVGLGLICYNNWQIAIGVYILLWANNMDWSRRLDVNLFKALDSMSHSFNVIHNKRE